MPHGPYLTTVLTNGSFFPVTAATDPPLPSMVAVPDKLTLDPRVWQVSKVSSNQQGRDWNASGSTLTGISTIGTSGGYANGTNYPTGEVIRCTTAATVQGTINIRNGGAEDGIGPSVSVINGSAGPQNHWSVTASSPGTGLQMSEVTVGQGSTGMNGITTAPPGGRSFYCNLNGPTSQVGITAQLMDTDGVTVLAAGASSNTSGLNYNYWTAYFAIIPASSTDTGRQVRLRVVVTFAGTTASAKFLSDTFNYSGDTIQLQYAWNVGSNFTAFAFDNISGGRADYSGSHVYTSPVIRMPSNWTATQEGINKVWYRVAVDLDIPTTPTGHGARIDLAVDTSTSSSFSYGGGDGPVTIINNYTTTGMGQGGGSATTGTSGLTVAITGGTALTTRPYCRFRITLNSGVAAPSATADTGTVTPVVKAVRIYFMNPNANFWWSQERDAGGAVSGWGLLNTTQTANGATITYYYRDGASETALHAANWTAITPGTAPAYTAGDRYIQFAVGIVPGASASALPFVDGLAFNFLNGNETASGPVASAFVDKRYWIFCQERNQTYNNRAWCLDSNLAWSKHNNMNALAACVHKNWMLMGLQRVANATSDITTGRVTIFDKSSDDDTNAVPWYLRTRDVPSPDLRAPMTIRAVDVLGRAIAPSSWPSVGSGLSGFGYTVAAANWSVAAVVAGQSSSPQVVTMGGSGVEYGHTNFSADRWGASVGAIILASNPAGKAQIDRVELACWIKEPAVR